MKMMKKGFGLIVGLVFLAMFAATPSHAGILLSDNFNSENGGVGALNYTGFKNWTVSTAPGMSGVGAGYGSVDLIGNGFYDFYPGNGLYVDLDGSTNNAGVLATKQTFAAGTYDVSFNLAGNDRGAPNNTVVVTLGSYSTNLSIANNAPFSPAYNLIINTTSPGQLSFHNLGGNNQGAILDNVAVSSVPVPPSVLLLAPGLLGLVGMRKRFKI
jgi:hypothetical protein